MGARETREEIVAAADELFYRQGFDHTSFADIAGAVKLSRGNFYYHFRTKDEILDAVIDRRLEATRAMLAGWAAEGASPVARIECFVRILIMNQIRIMAYGCPVGTLCQELAKLDHAARARAADVFALFRDWLTAEFEALGAGDEAGALALHVLGWSQGTAALANAFKDEVFVRREVDGMCAWLAAQARRLARARR
ncbi:transcriptional regulator [Hyphomonas sp. CACIAM 19H1]|uniref:TetR/AcrR family transcriptional regulator n=1 Tax=Hyphomonas sp. CACIAM 19H1 TaxID=1873716 RepID=UPI000DEDBD77|nr:transcriptional regulator [Hyphomonas sp. CACIAM 19H1]